MSSGNVWSQWRPVYYYEGANVLALSFDPGQYSLTSLMAADTCPSGRSAITAC
jgi:hypothetical protein